MFAELYPFKDAPKEYKELSPHDGEEEWLIHIPSQAQIEVAPFESFAESTGLNYSYHHLHGCVVIIITKPNSE